MRNESEIYMLASYHHSALHFIHFSLLYLTNQFDDADADDDDDDYEQHTSRLMQLHRMQRTYRMVNKILASRKYITRVVLYLQNT